MKPIAGHLGLVIAMALVTWGIVTWTVQNFSLALLWPFNGPPALHPVHVLALGIALRPAGFRLLARQAGLAAESRHD